MSWTFGNWQDFLKKKACRYILQHYLGQFFKQKLSLDQLSLDLYNGTGKLTDLNLDVQAINDDLASLSVPVELVDGFVECIVVSIPWSALIQDSTTLEVTGLELTLQPKQREDTGGFAGEMFSSMQSSMTTSLQLAKDCIESDSETRQKAEPIEGVQAFANMIDSVLSKIRVSLNNTVIRLEHHPDSSTKGVAMEIRIRRVEFFDDMATASEGTSVDGSTIYEPAAFSQKNLHIEGVQLFFDEISSRKSVSRSRSSSEGSNPPMYFSTRSSASGVFDSVTASKESSPPHQSSYLESDPIQVALLSGRQEIKLKTKQNDTLHGPKLEIRCQFGGFHILLSPRQLHGVIELLNALTSPGIGNTSSSKRPGMKSKPMDPMDFQKVEVDLQRQLQSGRIQSNNLAQLQDYSLQGDDDDQFYSLMSQKPGAPSDMESSFSSNYSSSTNRTTSTVPSGTNQLRGKTQRDTPKFHEDPSAELSHYYLRVAFFSVTLLHHNLSGNGDRSPQELMKQVASQYFKMVVGVTASGMSELKEKRKQLSDLVKHDHLRLLGRPLTVECNQKSALKQLSTTLSMTVGMAELVETLYSKNTTEYSELLIFLRDGNDVKKTAMYSSMQGGQPCFNMQLRTVARSKGTSRPGYLPETDIKIVLGELQVELDVTLIDRISTLITPEKIVAVSPLYAASLYQTVGQSYSLSQTLEEGTSSQEQKISLEVTSPLAKVHIRFPIPDLRKESHVDKSWYQRNLRDDVLIVDLERAVFRMSLITGQPLEKVQITASDLHGYYKFSSGEDAQHFAHVSGEGGEDGFNNPTITLKFCNNTTSVLEEETFMDDMVPLDSLNGACQFAKSEPSPFSSRRHMHDRDAESHKSDEKTEQMVLPADREELAEFMQKSTNNTKMMVEIVLPNVCAVLQNKNFFEILYNRLNNDMLLWEPSAPAPVAVSHDHFSMAKTIDLNVYNQLLHTGEHFEMAKSALQFDSDSDEDTDSINHYSIHDSRYPRRKRLPQQQQSKMCLQLTIGKGRVTAFTDSKDSSGAVQGDKHGEVLLQISDFLLFTVSAHNGDPNIQFVNILANRADLYHTACVENTEQRPLIDCSELSAPVPPHLQHNHLIYRSEPGLLINSKEEIGTGTDSQDMVAVALKIKLDTLASKRDLTSDEIVKEFLVSVGLRGATMRFNVVPPYQSMFIQMMEFLDVKDYPILGYVDPKVLTELHVHIWTCAIDYRPLYIPLRSVILADSFTISSNIVAESSISLLRFVLEDGALFISKKVKQQRTDLRRDYVCVADLERLELLLRSNTGNHPHYPKTDLRVSSNLVNIRTCADSCTALIDLLKYLAADGDLYPPEMPCTEVHSDSETDISANAEESEIEKSEEYSTLTTSSMDHVHNLMSEAMQESSNNSSSSISSKESSPDISATNLKQTEVFFVASNDPSIPGSQTSLREPIVITQTVDSVTSSMLSGGLAESLSDDEGRVDSDDFCMIDDAAWGKSLTDGEPAIRVFINTPIQIRDQYFTKPNGRTDLLKAPDDFPLADYRYTLKELTVVWYIYGGSDLTEADSDKGSDYARCTVEYTSMRDGSSISFHRGSPGDRWSGQAGGREVPLIPRETLQTKGGPNRDLSKYMELQLTKVRFQHEDYPKKTEQASRQVLLISDIEIRDKIKTSKMNKFLYQYSSDDKPRQTYANMLVIKALHRRPNPATAEEECALKVSLQPIRFNIDQDTLFFLKGFITDLSGKEETSVSPSSRLSARRSSSSTPPPPVMTVNKQEQGEVTPDPQDLLLQFDELAHDLQASLRGSLGASSHSDGGRSGLMRASVSSTGTITSETGRGSQPVFFKSFVFSPEVRIRLDYHGKFDREHGALAGLGGLVSLNSSELRLKRLAYKQGMLGGERVLRYCLEEWLTDIKVNQLPTILGGLGPLHSIVQLAYGVKDLFWLPVEQYRKDGRIIRGLQRGATSFSMSTAMSVLELTNRVVLGVQWCAERTFDIVSPGPRRRGFYPKQPADIREGVSNAYIVLREGFADTANTMVEVATKEHQTKGMMGAVGGVLRQIPPTMVQPLIIVPEAASNLIGGLRSHLKPAVKKEDEDKWKEEIID